MNDQENILKLITWLNWVLFAVASIIGLMVASQKFALGIILGGIIVTINFHLMASAIRKALSMGRASSGTTVIVKYFIRFILSGILIFALIKGQIVHPIGLVIGLSIVVSSILIATMNELTKTIFKEAV
jgi:hypothetical protein